MDVFWPLKLYHAVRYLFLARNERWSLNFIMHPIVSNFLPPRVRTFVHCVRAFYARMEVKSRLRIVVAAAANGLTYLQ